MTPQKSLIRTPGVPLLRDQTSFIIRCIISWSWNDLLLHYCFQKISNNKMMRKFQLKWALSTKKWKTEQTIFNSFPSKKELWVVIRIIKRFSLKVSSSPFQLASHKKIFTHHLPHYFHIKIDIYLFIYFLLFSPAHFFFVFHYWCAQQVKHNNNRLYTRTKKHSKEWHN